MSSLREGRLSFAMSLFASTSPPAPVLSTVTALLGPLFKGQLFKAMGTDLTEVIQRKRQRCRLDLKAIRMNWFAKE